MLKLLNGADNPIIPIDDFYIEEKYSGLDELVFDINVDDPVYPQIFEESVIEYEQPYIVKAIDGGKVFAKIKCQIDIDDLRSNMFIGYKSESGNPYTIITAALPTGWAVIDHAYITTHRTIELDAGNALDIIEKVRDTFGIVVRYSPKSKQIHLYDPDAFEPLGAFADESLNLQEVNYKGKSTEFATRLYGYGKDGLDVSSINGGKPYVDDHTYSDKVISVYWKDERYTVRENLLADMKKKLKELAVPTISYECKVADLAKTNPEMYGFQDFSLLQVIKLVDPKKGNAYNHQVVNYVRYPFYPERNVVTLSTVAPTMQKSLKQVQMSIEKPTSAFREIMQAAINSATEKITGPENGYVVLHKTSDGKYDELLIMDTEFTDTATKVWRWNMGGLGYSSNGYNGPYGTAITMDGSIVADYITTGTMSANHIRGGDLVLGGKYGDGIGENGQLHLKDAYGDDIVKLTSDDGVWATKGNIAGWNLTTSSLWRGSQAWGSENGIYFGSAGLSIFEKFKVDDSGNMSCHSGSFGTSLGNGVKPVVIGDSGLTVNAGGLKVNAGGITFDYASSIRYNDAQGTWYDILNSTQPSTNNPNIALSAAGGSLYLGWWNTQNVYFYKQHAGTSGRPGDPGVFGYEATFNYIYGSVNSSEKVKKNIALSNIDALSLVDNSKIYEFEYKDPHKPGHHFGFIVERETPEEVLNVDKDGVNTYNMTSILWKAVQELSGKVKIMEEYKNGN